MAKTLAKNPPDGLYLMWSQAKQERFEQSAWYDHTFYRIPVIERKNGVETPFKGPIPMGRIHDAMRKRYHCSLSGSAVGGYCSAGSVVDNGDGTVTFESIYHIGD